MQGKTAWENLKSSGNVLYMDQWAYTPVCTWDDITIFLMDMEIFIRLRNKTCNRFPRTAVKMSSNDGNLQKQFCSVDWINKSIILGVFNQCHLAQEKHNYFLVLQKSVNSCMFHKILVLYFHWFYDHVKWYTRRILRCGQDVWMRTQDFLKDHYG